MTYFSKNNKGFTLVESLVAISIFSVSVLTVLVMLSTGITNTSYAKQKVIAEYLAQEGIEYMRNLRDTYVLNDPLGAQHGWDAFNTNLVTHSCATTDGCYFDDTNVSYSDPSMPMTDLAFAACTSSTCSNAPLLYTPSNGKYNYDVSGQGTGFSRKIIVTQIGASPSNETRISSTVYWAQASGTHNVTFSVNLLNWVE